jgi:hypothetical protein
MEQTYRERRVAQGLPERPSPELIARIVDLFYPPATRKHDERSTSAA